MGSKWSNFIHFGVIMFFRKDRVRQKEGRDADPRIRFQINVAGTVHIDSPHARVERAISSQSAGAIILALFCENSPMCDD